MMMNVTIIYKNENPFAPTEHMWCVSNILIANNTHIDIIEKSARESTPGGLFLYEIKTPTTKYRYNQINNTRRIIH